MSSVETARLPRARTAPAELTIKPYAAACAAAWDDYARRAPAATFCHLFGWARVIERVWGHRPCHLYAERAGAITGVLPLFHVRSRLFGSMLVSTPNAVYGGVAADDAETRAALIAAAKEAATQLQVDYLELRHSRASSEAVEDPELQRKNLYVAFEHSITADEEALMRSFPRDLRRMIRQGPKHHLAAETGRAELLDEFYEVYATSLRNLGTPVFPKRLFAEFLREFPDASDIVLVRQGAQVAGAVLSFYFRDMVMPYYAGAYPEFYRAGINNFMYWELMRHAAARGCLRFDFGRSKLGTGACAFKRGWGMTERPLPYQYFLVRARHLPDLSPANPKFGLMIKLWQRLPLGVTKLIGPRIVRHLP
jgi:FemAB-related protein (PEP-CTERM system-associated)